MCTLCNQKYKLNEKTMKEDPVHCLEQEAKPKSGNKPISKNSETSVLQARIDEFDQKRRNGEEAVVLEPVEGAAQASELPMLKTRRQKGLMGFVQSVFHMF